MTENSDPLENAVAERINKTIKEEFTEEKQISFSNYWEAIITISQIIKFYNDERSHRSLDMYTPSIAYEINKELKRKWKTYWGQVRLIRLGRFIGFQQNEIKLRIRSLVFYKEGHSI